MQQDIRYGVGNEISSLNTQLIGEEHCPVCPAEAIIDISDPPQCQSADQQQYMFRHLKAETSLRLAVKFN